MCQTADIPVKEWVPGNGSKEKAMNLLPQLKSFTMHFQYVEHHKAEGRCICKLRENVVEENPNLFGSAWPTEAQFDHERSLSPKQTAY